MRRRLAAQHHPHRPASPAGLPDGGRRRGVSFPVHSGTGAQGRRMMPAATPVKGGQPGGTQPPSDEADQIVEIFTDGACLNNPGPGGWGAILRLGPHEKEIHGGEPDTTNNRMELTAAIKGLESLRRPST